MDYMTTIEAAEALGVCVNTVYCWLRKGKLEQGPRLGVSYTIKKESIEELKNDRWFMARVRTAQARRKGQVLRLQKKR